MKINVRKQAADIGAKHVGVIDVLDGQIPRKGDVMLLDRVWWVVEYVEYGACSRDDEVVYLEPSIVWVRNQ